MNHQANNIKVSVAMPAYNAGRFVEDAIESVLAQDFDSFELIVLDDGSKDNTRTVINRFRKHPKVRIFTNKKNLGSGITRNKIVRLSRGKYITPCDADDIMLPGNLKRLSEFLDRHSDIGTVYGNFLAVTVDDKGGLVKELYTIGKDYQKSWDLWENPVNHGGSMIRKSLIMKVGGYDEKTKYVDDWSLFLKLAEITKFKYLKNETYYVWRRNSNSITNTSKNKWHSDVDQILKEAIQRRYGFISP